ncbi:MAG: hypothetical protein M1818_004519 [Claussenomyces sp. TS43310]|nr:MAG: hypothetical protein M1818_004519 [Claussenomyces sp. TS43310]
MLDWLTTVDYTPYQSDLITRREDGTGLWLLDSTEFQSWVKTDKQIMFCPSIPGAGKTILTSIVVEELTARFHDDKSIGIAYLYCNFRRHDEQKVGDLFTSLLKQLSQRQASAPETIKSLYNSHKDKPTRPSLAEISRALQSVASTCTRVFIVVDALDECQVTGGVQAAFLSEIFDLQAKCRVNLFATSRHLPEIVERFQGSIKLEILASEDDVRRYVDGHISHLPSFVRRSPDLQEVKTEIVNAVNGMFLLAQLHLDSFIGKRSPKAIRAALKKLPSGSTAYDHAYTDAMIRIEGQTLDQEELAKQVLLWITCATRPTTMSELQDALAVEVGESKLDEENLPQLEDLITVCAGLVTVDEESDIIRLVHYTAQDYFQRQQSTWFPNAAAEITTVCITYLSFDTFNSGYCQTDDEFEERLQLNKLYDYAAHNWGHHARAASASLKVVQQFLQKQAQVEASIQALMAFKRWRGHREYSQEIPKQMTSVHLAGYLGVNDMIRDLSSSSSLDLEDSYGRTPLSWAAGRGNVASFQLLLDLGKVEIDSKDRDGRTPLMCAVIRGHMAVVQLLLDLSEVKVNSKDKIGRTPLSWAAKEGHKAIVRLLLDSGKVEVDSKDNRGWTPLSFAVWEGHGAIVQLLLDSGKVEEAIVQLLLDSGKAEVDSKDDNGWTALLRAAKGGHEAVVQMLLNNGADADIENESGHTALQLAVLHGHNNP